MSRIVRFAVAVCATGAFSLACGVNIGPAPAAGQYVDAKATAWVLGSDRVPYRIDAELIVPTTLVVEQAGYVESAEASSGTPNNLVVWVYKCPARKCPTKTTPFVQPVAPPVTSPAPTAAVYDDRDLSTVTTRIFGWTSSLAVRWQGTPPASAADTPAQSGSDMRGASTWRAKATLSFLGVQCTNIAATVTRTTTISPLGLASPVGKLVPPTSVPGVPAKVLKCLPG
jgi:hypothetical protein